MITTKKSFPFLIFLSTTTCFLIILSTTTLLHGFFSSTTTTTGVHALVSPEYAQYSGKLRHVSTPHSQDTLKFDRSYLSRQEREKNLGSAFRKTSGDDDENSITKKAEEEETHENEIYKKEQTPAKKFDDSENEEVDLELSLKDLDQLIKKSLSSVVKSEEDEENSENNNYQNKWTNLNWNKFTVFEKSENENFFTSFENNNNNMKQNSSSSSDSICRARLVGMISPSSSSSTKQQQQNQHFGPRALEISCENLHHIINSATQKILTHRQEILKEKEQQEMLLEEIRKHSSFSSDNINNNKKRNKNKKKKKKLDPDHDPSISPFDFLGWNESSLLWPIARVSAVIHQKNTHPDDSPRWYEGTSSACLETNSLSSISSTSSSSSSKNSEKSDSWENKISSESGELEQHISPSQIRVIIPLHFPGGDDNDDEDFSSPEKQQQQPIITNLKHFIQDGMLSVKIKLVPLGSRSPLHRQLIRWLRFHSSVTTTPTENSENENENNNNNEIIENDADDLLMNNSFFELKATEKRLTRIGFGFRARLRRHDDDDDENNKNNNSKNQNEENENNNNNNDNSPIFSKWSVEVLRRVPRPRVECVAMFSRLLSVPSVFKEDPSDSNNNKEEKSSGGGDELDDEFDDDYDSENNKKSRKNKRGDGYISGFPGMEAVEEAQLQLVSSSQLRGMLDDHFSLPELSRLSPSHWIPAGPRPQSISEIEEQRARKLPPRGLFVLYVSEERTRQHTVDVAVEHADFQFMAPLKLEKRVLNFTFEGQHEKLPLPVPPFGNWIWYDSTNISTYAPLHHQTKQHQQQQKPGKLPPSSHPSSSSSSSSDTKSLLTAADRLKQAEINARSMIPKLLFHYHNDSRFPGFSILLEQTRPLDELIVWVCDGKNDTLFVDEEQHVPFTVPGQQHDAVDNPLFGWRFALDSQQRSFALDTLYVTLGFKFRSSSSSTSSENDNSENNSKNSNSHLVSNLRKLKKKKTSADYVAALVQYEPGKEASQHLLSWIDLHRWIPLKITGEATSAAAKRRRKNRKTKTTTTTSAILPFFANYLDTLRHDLLFSSSTKNNNNNNLLLSSSLDLSINTEDNNWRLITKREFEKNEDIFTLPWSVLIRHTQAPNWIIKMVHCKEFEEEVLRKHDQYLLSSDHVDVDFNEKFEEEDNDSDNDSNNFSRDDDKEFERFSQSKEAAEEEEEILLSESRRTVNNKIPKTRYEKIRQKIRSNRNSVYQNVKAWTILCLMHWAQIEPELSDSDHDSWHGSKVPLRWHAHYRMFSERVKSDPAARLRQFVVSRSFASSNSRLKLDLPPSSWSSVSESLKKRNSFLYSVAEYLLESHPSLPRKFSGGELNAKEWFASAYTIIEARSLLVKIPKNNKNKNENVVAEWVYTPLLDLATPNSGGTENIQVGFVEATSMKYRSSSATSSSSSTITSSLGVKIAAKTKISSGSPLIFDGWSGNGMRTNNHGLELFGFLLPKSGFVDTASILLPFGPSLTKTFLKKNSEIISEIKNPETGKVEKIEKFNREHISVIEECRSRCRRVADGKPVTVNDFGESCSRTKSLREKQQQVEEKVEKISSCCSFEWLDSELRKKWRQVVANELYWNVQPKETLHRLISTSCAMKNIGNVPVFRDSVSSSKQNVVGVSASTLEPPYWKLSRQQLLSGTRQVLEYHIAEVSKMLMKLSSLNNNNENIKNNNNFVNISTLSLNERIAYVFNGEKKYVEDYFLGDDDDENEEEEFLNSKWFKCCQVVKGSDDDKENFVTSSSSGGDL